MSNKQEKVISLLNAIVHIGGNMPDNRLEEATGPNDARQRGIMYTNARTFAKEALEIIQASPAPADGWQSIETAPRDGTEISVCNSDGYQREIVFWDTDPSCAGWSTTDGESFYPYKGTPTHWQPLPAPPQADEAGCPHCDDGSVYLDGPSGLHPHECGTCSGTGKAAEVTG